MSELADWAERYAYARIPVFPLRARSKSPAIAAAHPEGSRLHGICRGECGAWGHGLYDATTDHAQIGRWWDRWPKANIGVPTGPASGWLVVDLDGAEGLAAWAALEALHGQAPTLTSITGRGRHLVYAWPPGCEFANSAGRLGPHVDTRGIGGYIVAPPSSHPTGATYRWDQTGGNAPQTPPPWLLEALEPPAPAPRQAPWQGGACVVGAVPSDLPRHLQRQAAEAPNGDRSRQTYRLVCASIEYGLSDSEVHALLAAHEPTQEKYGDRATDQVEAIVGRVRGQHRHEGRPCDLAGCPNAPRWMVAS